MKIDSYLLIELQKIKLEEEKQLKEMDEMINSYRRKWGLDEL